MSEREFWDDFDSVAINEAIHVSGMAGEKIWTDGEEIPIMEWVFTDSKKKKSSFKMIKG